jgi:hypothetical protein
MPWTLKDIETEWLIPGEPLMFPADIFLEAFRVAEEIRGEAWVRSCTYLPSGYRQLGYASILRVLWFAERAQVIRDGINAATLIDRLRAGDAAAESELTAIHVLRSDNRDTTLEIGPTVQVGPRMRKPDFRIAKQGEPWTHVEVTALHRSNASQQVQAVLAQLTDRIMASTDSFVLEFVFSRIPNDEELSALLARAAQEIGDPNPRRVEFSDLAVLIFKELATAITVSPTPTGDAPVPMYAMARTFQGPDEATKQVLARMPFSDQRAEDVLNSEAEQLPKDTPGLIMVEVTAQPTALSSWEALSRRRFTPTQHTRVGGIILFMHATQPTDQGLAFLPHVKLLANPHARLPLSKWISDTVEATRNQVRAITGRPD